MILQHFIGDGSDECANSQCKCPIGKVSRGVFRQDMKEDWYCDKSNDLGKPHESADEDIGQDRQEIVAIPPGGRRDIIPDMLKPA